MTRVRRSPTSPAVSPRPSTTGLDPHDLATATDAELAELFRTVSTQPLDVLVNRGGHTVDFVSRTVFNDEHWKGWLPRGLALRDIFTRLGSGYAKRFWMQGRRCLGETLYLEGRIRVRHLLEEFTLTEPTNDLAPGTYVLLHYTDPVFEHQFYDVMKAANDGVIIYGGYRGRFPAGTRGFTSVLMRRYGFAQIGVRDHQLLSGKGARPTPDALLGTWRLDAIATSDHPSRVATLTCTPDDDGRSRVECVPVDAPEVLVPSFVPDHFSGAPAPIVDELRVLDATTMLGTWSLGLGPLYARFVAASPGLFHRDRERGRGRYTMRYLLTRAGGS